MDKDKKLWEEYGETDAYHAISTFDKFKSDNIDESTLDEFFDSGENHVQKIWSQINKHFIDDFKPESVMDYGCGVGRVAIPLSKRCKKVTGIDISSTMIEKAKAHAAQRGISNIDYKQVSEDLFESKEQFDFVHSFIVIQHIQLKLGYKVFESLVKKVKKGGIGMLHVTYHNPSPLTSKVAVEVYKKLPIVYKLRNNIKNEEEEAFLPMHNYDLNKLFIILQENNCHNNFIKYTFHGINGVMIFFEKREDIFI